MTPLGYLITFLVLVAVFWAAVMWIVARRFKVVLRENLVLKRELQSATTLQRLAEGHNARFARAIRAHRDIVFHPGAVPAQSDVDLWSALNNPDKEGK